MGYKIVNKTKKLTTLGILGALSVLLVVCVHFPIFPTAHFLEYDPADIPIFIGTFLFGPLWGFLLTVAVSLVQGFTVSAGSGIVGIAMHIFSTGSFVIVAGNIYKKNKTKKSAIVALAIGTLTMALAMTLWNVIVTPVYMGVERQMVVEMLLPVFIPFNLIKAGANSIFTMIIYKKISHLVNKL